MMQKEIWQNMRKAYTAKTFKILLREIKDLNKWKDTCIHKL